MCSFLSRHTRAAIEHSKNTMMCTFFVAADSRTKRSTANRSHTCSGGESNFLHSLICHCIWKCMLTWASVHGDPIGSKHVPLQIWHHPLCELATISCGELTICNGIARQRLGAWEMGDPTLWGMSQPCVPIRMHPSCPLIWRIAW
jgi:hypothetical protein